MRSEFRTRIALLVVKGISSSLWQNFRYISYPSLQMKHLPFVKSKREHPGGTNISEMHEKPLRMNFGKHLVQIPLTFDAHAGRESTQTPPDKENPAEHCEHAPLGSVF